MKTTKLLALGCSALAIFTFASCNKKAEGSATKAVTLRLAHNLNEQHSVHIALQSFADMVKERTGGQVSIQIYPNGQLGSSESEELEQLKAGAIDMTKVSASALTTYNDAYNAFTLPYIFADEAHFYKCMASDAVKNVYDATLDQGFKGLTFYDSGARSFYTKDRPILTPADLKGLKIRVMGFQSQTDMMKAMGGTPVSMSFGEVFTSLQSGVIDGAENNETGLTVGGRHGEVAKCYSFDEHARIPDILVISTKAWNKLTPEQQDIVKKAAAESTEAHKVMWKKSVEDAKKEAAETMNVKFYTVDKAPFRAAVAPMVEKYKIDMPAVKTLLDSFASLE